jgi:osmotically-inducible protein OsmY
MLGADVMDRPGEIGGRNGSDQGEMATEAAVRSRFRGSPHWDFGGVTFHFFAGVLTLQGVVGSYYVKQMAQELVRSIPTVQQIDNRLRVISVAGRERRMPR